MSWTFVASPLVLAPLVGTVSLLAIAICYPLLLSVFPYLAITFLSCPRRPGHLLWLFDFPSKHFPQKVSWDSLIILSLMPVLICCFATNGILSISPKQSQWFLSPLKHGSHLSPGNPQMKGLPAATMFTVPENSVSSNPAGTLLSPRNCCLVCPKFQDSHNDYSVHLLLSFAFWNP